MSIIPILFRDSFMDDFLGSPREHLFNRTHPDDILVSINNIPLHLGYQRSRPYHHHHHLVRKENQAQDGSFEVSVDVQHFKPEEISVKLSENYITVEGKHEEKEDEHGYVFRHFVRRYRVPEGHDLEKLASSLSSDGVLKIKAPKLALPGPEKEKSIPIMVTGKPAKHIENGAAKENEKEAKKA